MLLMYADEMILNIVTDIEAAFTDIEAAFTDIEAAFTEEPAESFINMYKQYSSNLAFDYQW